MTLALTAADFTALGHLLVLLLGGLFVLLLESFAPQAAKKYSAPITLATFAISLYATFLAPDSTNKLLTPWLRFDPLAHFFAVLFLVVGIGSTFLAAAFFNRFKATEGEYYFLLISAVFGLILIGDSADFLTLFLGLETLSISLYVLCGYMKRWEISHEAALKYFLMGALAAAFLLYGIALIYGATGTTQFSPLLAKYKALTASPQQALFLSGIALVTLGLAFKAAIVPFHVWAPDVYEGAPTPVTAFMAVGTKAGAFAAFVIVFLLALPNFDTRWNEAIAFLAFPTLIYANIVALRQFQLRRFFAYSGISHAGFMLIPLAAGTPDALSALLFYLVVYGVATFGCFAVLAFLDERGEGVTIRDLHGLFRSRPYLAGIFAFCMLTLAGIPPTAGFFAKLYIFKVAYEAGYYALLIVGLLTTILSAYYYLRFVGVMFSEPSAEQETSGISWPAGVVGALSVIGIVLLSVYPTPLLKILAFFTT